MVRWLDAEVGEGSWDTVKSKARHNTPFVCSVGFLLKNNKKRVVITGSVAPSGKRIKRKTHALGDIVIPSGMVRAMVVLKPEE